MADEGRIKLPERSTRGKRMRAQLQEEDNEAGKGIMHYKPTLRLTWAAHTRRLALYHMCPLSI